MGYFSNTLIVHELISRRSKLYSEKSKIQMKIDALTRYTSAVGKQEFTIEDLLNVPAMLTGRTMAYLAYAHNNAMQYVQQNAPYLTQMYAQQNPNQTPEQAQQMQEYINRQLYAQARQMASDQEKENMHIIEKKMEQEKEDIENDIKVVEKRLELARADRDKGLDFLLPKSA